MSDPVSLAWLVGFVVSLLALVLSWPRTIRRVPPVPLTAWRIVVPRAASFSVAQSAAWFVALKPLLDSEPAGLVVQLVGHARELHLQLTAPSAWGTALRAQLAAWFPESRLEPWVAAQDTGVVVRQTLQLKKPELLSLRLASDGEADPLLGLVGALTHLDADCGLQLSCRREPRDWKAWSTSALHALKAGTVLLPRHWPVGWRVVCELALHAISPNSPSREGAALSALATATTKAREPVFATQVAVWAQAPTEERALARLRQLTAHLETVSRDPFGNRLIPQGKPVYVTAQPPNLPNASRSCVLSAWELASLFHLPIASHPLVLTEPGRRAGPAADLLSSPPTESSPQTCLGEALRPEGPQLVSLGPEERRLHLYVIGKTGTGKSTFLANLARQDLAHGHGLALIDPHGDLAEHVLSLVPPARFAEVLYFNAADTDFPVGFNVLATRTPAERPLVASGVVGVFKKLYGDSWGPRLEHFLRNSILTLLETPSPSLLLLPRLLTDKAVRQRLLAHVQDPLLRTFFLEEFERYDPRWRAEAISPILNKVGQFLSAPAVRHIVGQSGPGFNLRELMDRGGIFIANLASGRIGEDSCDLLGGLLVAGFQLAAMSRANQPEAERRDFYLHVDEFQRFSNDAFTSILSEARKYRLALTLSHQYLDQVPETISEAVFGNVGSLAAFRVGAGDVGRLAKEFAPVFDGQDLVHLPNHHFCARLARPRGTAPAFSARTLPPTPTAGVPEALILQSRQRWARPRAEVEREILNAWHDRHSSEPPH